MYLGEISYLWITRTLIFRFLVMSAMGLKARVDPSLGWFVCCLQSRVKFKILQAPHSFSLKKCGRLKSVFVVPPRFQGRADPLQACSVARVWVHSHQAAAAASQLVDWLHWLVPVIFTPSVRISTTQTHWRWRWRLVWISFMSCSSLSTFFVKHVFQLKF